MTMKWLNKFIFGENTPRWQIIVGGVIVLFLGVVQNEFYYRRSVADAEIAAQQSRVEAKVLELQQHSIDFQTYAGAFVSSILDNTGEVTARRSALIGNILAQDAAIDISASVLGDAVAPQLSQYRKALLNMKVSVEQVSDVVSMGAFWAAASDMLVARNDLLQALATYSKNTGT
jgi:hypothetical protein